MMASLFSTNLLRHVQVLATTYLGLVHGLLAAIEEKSLRPDALANHAGCDPGYVARWIDAALAQGLITRNENGYLALSEQTQGLRMSRDNPDAARVLQAVYSVLICDAMVPNFRGGDQPGYPIVQRFVNLVPYYGAITESLYGTIFDGTILRHLSSLIPGREVTRRVLDFGCGDGWLIRRMARTQPAWRFLGVTSSQPQELPVCTNVEYVTHDDFRADSRSFDLIVVNKVLHHLGDALADTLKRLAGKLAPQGGILIWEFAWPPANGQSPAPDDRGFLNLIEHVQKGEFLTSRHVLSLLASLGLAVESDSICGGREVVYWAFRSRRALNEGSAG